MLTFKVIFPEKGLRSEDCTGCLTLLSLPTLMEYSTTAKQIAEIPHGQKMETGKLTQV